MIWTLISLVILASPADPSSESEFNQLHAKLVPKSLAKWQTIPWKVDLLEARDLASKSGKPLFLWSMNGHPLGCT